MGSGTNIKRAIAKYGLPNFTKTVLAVFDSQDQMFEEEHNLISKLNPEYNIHPGGNGGFQYVNSVGINNQNKDMVAIGRKIGDKLRGKSKPGHVLKALRDSHQGRDPSIYATFVGRSHSDETKTRIGTANAKHQSGSGNSRYGTQWITDGTVSKTISRGDSIPDGWRIGRVIRPK
jgi:group I intron endonuclease